MATAPGSNEVPLLLPLTLSLSNFGIYFYPLARQRRAPNAISF
jgi:hypothetical protein